MKNTRLLIVDDEQAQRDSLTGYYNKRMNVYSAGSSTVINFPKTW